MKKEILVILSILFIGIIQSFAQQKIEVKKTKKNIWIPYNQKGDVSIYYKIKNCTKVNSWSQERILFKFVNKTDKSLSLTFFSNMEYSKNSPQDNPLRQFTLKPREVLESKDLQDYFDGFYIFSKSTDNRVLLDSYLISFSLSNIQSHEIYQ